ncbi:MAG: LCP family protein [Propionibacteriaceae bacterium]|nr:LCP family protein [Micropruina sp.]
MPRNRAPGHAGVARRVAPPDSQPFGGSSRAPVRANRSFSVAVLFTIVGTALPGLGLLRAGHRRAGTIVLTCALILVGGIAAIAAFRRQWLLDAAVNPTVLVGIAAFLLIAGLTWGVVVVATHLSLRPRPATTSQRAIGAALVGVLVFAIAAPVGFAAQLSLSQASLVQTVFGGDNTTATTTKIDAADPWKDKSRLNILLLGGDSGDGRKVSLGARTDTVIVASIDTHTGATALFQLPRQTARMPFPKDSPLYPFYPKGFYDGSNPDNEEFTLNAEYDNVAQKTGRTILGPTSNFGADVLKLSVGEALGLKLDYYVFVNLDGFVTIIDALGGIEVNVNWTVAIGGNKDAQGRITVKPVAILQPEANVHLDGTWALAYARSRLLHDDYYRNVQQRCVINAVLQSAEPAKVLANYESIARAGKTSIMTDVPSALLPTLAELAAKIKGGNLQSVGFMDGVGGYHYANPNFDEMREYVQKVIADQAATVSASTAASASATPSASTSATSAAATTPSATATTAPTTQSATTPAATKTAMGAAQDLTDQCAFHPMAAK